MYDALINIFNLIYDAIILPTRNALLETNIFHPIINYANMILNNIMKLWNNNNSLSGLINYDLIASIIGLIVLVIIIEITYAIFKIVFTAFETIEKNINSFDNKQRWKKRGGHKKKWNY